MSDNKIYNKTKEELEELLPYYIYSPVNWEDRVAEFPNTWQETDIGNNAIQHTRADGFIEVIGTPRNAKNFGNTDLGLYLAWSLIRDLESRVGKLELQVENLHNAMFNNETSNTFRADFVTIGKEHGITIVGGWYDEVRKEVVW